MLKSIGGAFDISGNMSKYVICLQEPIPANTP
jgi:hypothetical protein